MKDIIEVKVSNNCNLNCKHCLWKHKDNSVMDMNILRNILSQNSNIKKVYITGGEPMIMHPDSLLLFDKIIDDYQYIDWNIATNLCYPLHSYQINILKKMNDVLTSFDIGIRFNNIHNLLLWKRNVQSLIKEGVNLRISCCLTKQMIKKNPMKFKRFFDKLGVKGVAYLNLFDVGWTHENKKELMPTKEEFRSWLEKNYAIGDFQKNEIFSFIINNKYKCEFTDTDPIDIDGTIMHCMCEETRNSKCRIAMECLNCEDFESCGGRCPLSPCVYYDKDLFQKIKKIGN